MTTFRILLGLGAISLATIPALANLIQNGGFETGDVTGYGFASVPAPWYGTSALADTFDHTGVTAMTELDLGGTPLMRGVMAYEGNRWIGMHSPYSTNGPDSLSQDFQVPLTVGETYTVSLALLTDNRGGIGGIMVGFAGIDVFVDDLYVGTLAPNTVGLEWQLRSLSFVAPTAATTITLAGQFDGPSAYMGIDDVRVVPEPATMLALGVGLVAVSRRRIARR